MEPLRPACLIGIAALSAVFGLSVFGVSVFENDTFLIPSLVGVLWLLTLYSFIVCFQTLPAALPAGAGLIERVRQRVRRAGYWAIAVVLLGISGSVVWLSLRFLRVWYAQFAG